MKSIDLVFRRIWITRYILEWLKGEYKRTISEMTQINEGNDFTREGESMLRGEDVRKKMNCFWLLRKILHMR